MKHAEMGRAIFWGVLVIGIIIILWKGASYASDLSGGGNGQSVADKGAIIVYGSKTCPWCHKQEEYLNSKGISFKFVNCPTETCPDYVKSFPTILVNNEIKVGYTEL
jgi:glutaredoxin